MIQLTGPPPYIEVFRTSIAHPAQASWLQRRLLQLYPQYQVNFDLDDCDRILRVAAPAAIHNEAIIHTAAGIGVWVEVLEG